MSLLAALRHGSLVLALCEKRVTIQTQLSGLAPTFRHRAVESAGRLRHFIFFATNVSERSRSISSSFSDIGDPGRAGAFLECELPLNLVMNGVR